jgi:membrane-bound lytic murein transglycosylase F
MNEEDNTRAGKTAAILAISILILLAVHFPPSENPSDRYPRSTLATILEKGTLTVLTRNAPTTYYEGPRGPVGFEYELASHFAKYLKVALKVKLMDNVGDILTAMNNGEADLASAGIAKTDQNCKTYLFGPSYCSVHEEVVYRRGSTRPRNEDDLLGYTILVPAGSYGEARLMALKKKMPGLTWTTTDQLSTEEILEKVWRKEVDCTIADSHVVAMNRRYYPELAVAFHLSDDESLGWVIKPGSRRLQAAIKSWFERFRSSGKLTEITDHYFGNRNRLNYVDIKMFHRRIKSRLPKLMPEFLEASVRYQLPWELLAAQAYQESHWEPQAESPTGVRGVMMLTEETAASLGIEDRVDPAKSIHGGAKYLAHLLKRVPKAVTGSNRIKFALAAYNIGMGHLNDAQELARLQGKDPNSWQSIRETLPLLTQKKYYKTLTYGYARGEEPLQYVNAILTYRDILEKYYAMF